MSKVERLRVMGIRSFGPEESDFQEIRFYSPLTLIVGPNGTGKTTIIECLKYITTGDIPPGAKGAFVHDPKVAHETMVRGQVRLQLRDMTGKMIQVVRSLEATQKAKNVTTKTLDAVITRFKPDGEKVSISSRCADFEREMITALGVSKSVLDSVIFCHQEDSCWPLSEGRQLKDRFDNIFASTRYSKVLDNIRKLKQTQEGNVKIFKEEMKHLKVQKDEAVKLESDLSEHQAKYEAAKVAVEKNEKDLQPVREDLNKISVRYNEIVEVQTKIEMLENKKDQIETQMQTLQENIENEFKGTTEDLEKQLSDFAGKLQEHREGLTQLEQGSKKLSQQLDMLKKENSTLLVDVGRLEREAESHEDNIRKRDADVRKLALSFGFEGFDFGAITNEKYSTFLEKIQQKLNTMTENVHKNKTDFEEKEKAIQSKMDMVREKKTQLEQTKKFKKDQMDKNKAEIRQIKQKLSNMEASKGRRDHLMEELTKAEQDLSDAESSVNLPDLKKEIIQLDKERRQLDLEKNELDEEMTRINLQSNTRAQLDMLKKGKTEREDHISRLKAKHEDSLKHLMGAVPTEDLRRRLDDYIGQQTSSTRKYSAEIQKAKTQLSQKEAEKNLLGKQIKEKESEARALEERIENVCGSQNYEEGFSTVEESLSKAQNARGSLVGAEHFFNKYKSDLSRNDPCCPLCHRSFETAQEVRELVLELESKLRLVPTKLHEAEADLKTQQKNYDEMIQLRPIKEQLAGIRDKDLPSLKARQQQVAEEFQKLKQVIEEKEDELSVKESDEALSKDMQPDIVLIDRYQADVRESDKRITEQMRNLQGADVDRSLDVVVNEKRKLQTKLEQVRSNLDSKQKQQSLYENRVQSLRSQINDLHREKLNIDAELQQRAKLEEMQTKLTSDNAEFEVDIQAAVEQLYPLEGEIKRHQSEMAEVTKDKDVTLDEGRNAIDEVRGSVNAVKEIAKNINAYNQSDRRDRLEKKRERQKELNREQSKLDKEQAEVTASINNKRDILANQQIRERELLDNRELRRQHEHVLQLKQQIKDLVQELGGLDRRTLEQERQKLLLKDERLESERQKNKMRMQEHDTVIKTKREALGGPVFRDANKKYREKMIDLKTTELANTDLEKYYKAMDRAIMNYHVQKMAEINTIIRELWRNTYRGNDIDTIEIRSDNDESGIMKSRRTYNYRVVMVKGDADLDMRGRCSAGQKVLASLIIRLALSETFCLNCGVIALDEPTTNLDSDNIESLAAALVRIIETRRLQRGFQLIVITHDESFVEKLGRNNLTEFYWGVKKDQNGISRVKRIPIQELERKH